MVENRAKQLAEASPEDQSKQIEDMLQKLETEIEYQKSPLHAADKVINFGGETQSEVRTMMLSAILARYLELTGQEELPVQSEDDLLEGLNFDMDLGKAEMADLKQEVEGGTPTPRKVDPAKTNLGSSQFESGSEELDSLSGVRAFASGVAKNAPDYSSKMKMKETKLNVDNITSDPSMFGGNKNALYDIPTPRHFSQTIVKPPTIDPQSSEGASGMASPARNDSPRFSPFDTNNPTLGPVLSIYNALV